MAVRNTFALREQARWLRISLPNHSLHPPQLINSFSLEGTSGCERAWVRGSLAHGSHSVGRWMNGAEWQMEPGRWSSGGMQTTMCTLHPGVLFEVHTSLQGLKFALHLAPSPESLRKKVACWPPPIRSAFSSLLSSSPPLATLG